MSELKTFEIVLAEERNFTGVVKYRKTCYDKTEADKYIVEIKQKLHDAEEELHNWKAEVTRVRNEKMALFDEMSKNVYNEKMKADLAEAANTEYREDIKKLKAENERLKDKVRHYPMMAMLIEDGNEKLRATRRALYKACANWANVEVFERTVGIDDPNVEACRWALMRNKCLKKAEEYK